MAYTFNSINSALDGNEKLDMFNQQPARAKPQFGGSSGGNIQLSSSGGGGASSPAPQSGSSAPVQTSGTRSPSSYTPSDAQKAFRGVGPVDSSQQREKITGDIAGANSKLQAEADAYTKKVGETAQGYNLDSGTLEKAASGDDAAFQAAQTRLAKAQNDPFESFKGLESKDLPTSANNLKKKETFGEIYRDTSSPNYGTGESRFQSLLLGMDPNFRADASSLVGAQEKLTKENDTAVVDKTKAANEQLSKAYTDATGKIRSDLTGLSDKVVSEADQRAVAEAAVRAGLDPKKLSQQEFQKIADRLRKDFAGSDGLLGRSMSFLDDPSAFDLSSFVNIDKDVTGSEMMTKEEVDRFNRINGLLGNGNMATFNQQGAGPQYGFDELGAAEALRSQLEGKRGAEDQRLQGLISQIQAGATARSTADQGDAIQNAKDYVTNRYLNANEGQSLQQMAAEKEAFNQLFREGTNWEPYFNQVGAINTQNQAPRSWQDMLTPQEAQQLNEYSKSLGVQNQYNQGSAYNTPNFNQDYFNTNFEKTFDRILGELNGTVPLTNGEGLGRHTTINPLITGSSQASRDPYERIQTNYR